MRRLTFGLMCTCLILSCSSLAGAAEYFVCNQPGTGAGTLENPYKMGDLPNPSLPYDNGTACSILQPGDTLTFLGGTYTFDTRTTAAQATFGYIHPVRNGTADAPITFRAKPGDTVRMVVASGRQCAMGTVFAPGGQVMSYARFVGFYVEQQSPNTGGEQFGFHIRGTSNEVAYCQSKGYTIGTGDNFIGFRIEASNYIWLHHSEAFNWKTTSPGAGGANAAGVQVYTSKNLRVEDCYSHDNNTGLFDKDSAVNNIYDRNYSRNNSSSAFCGNNQANAASYTVRNNVLVGLMEMHTLTTSATFNDNLIINNYIGSAGYGGVSAYAGANVYKTGFYNNIVFCSTANPAKFVAYTNPYQSFTTTSPYNSFSYFDYNAYQAAPTYQFAYYSKPYVEYTLSQMQALGFELNATVASLGTIFTDTVSYQVKAPYTTAGRYGDCLGPDNATTAMILDTNRYGPAALPIPTGQADSYTTNINTQLVVADPGVLANDTADDGWALSAVKLTDPAHGTLVLSSTGGFTYTPTTGYTGSDSFTYYAKNAYAESAATTVTITIINPVPTAENDSYSVYANHTLTVAAASGLLLNDTGAGTLTAVKMTDPSHGSLSLNSDGCFTYTPTTNYSGSDSYTYKAHNAGGDSNTATVSITVNQPERVLIDCGSNYLSSSTTPNSDGRYWNNFTTYNSSPSIITSCTNSVGSLSGIKLTRTTNFFYYGPCTYITVPVNGWPVSAAADYLSLASTTVPGTMEFSMLDTTGCKTYDLTVYGSMSSGATTRYTVLASSTTSRDIYTAGNTTRWATFSDLTPDANGKIIMQALLMTNGGRGALNVMDLAIYDNSVGGQSMMDGSGSSTTESTSIASTGTTTKTVSAGVESAASASSVSSPAGQNAAVALNVNFQPASVVAPQGYLVDSGMPFAKAGNGYSYGWTTDLSSFAVQCNNAASLDVRYDTAIMLVAGGTWEIAVPNGMYDVKIVSGAGDSSSLSAQKFTVEGVPATQTQSQAQAKAAGWSEETVTVVVTDGKLTITGQPGSSICFIQITGR
jgi:hypothetical protein